jgi:hypothetical protein
LYSAISDAHGISKSTPKYAVILPYTVRLTTDPQTFNCAVCDAYLRHFRQRGYKNHILAETLSLRALRAIHAEAFQWLHDGAIPFEWSPRETDTGADFMVAEFRFSSLTDATMFKLRFA